ncbi:outer membrane protein [Comamonas odontotermitis]|uniref:Outer membrane protein n=2 Tax=Comamonas odontotermitis TaxID=379895 RepID=A0ABR6RFS0_9BURK|nr:outer membrane protein [Comamonas odontotermitis]
MMMKKAMMAAVAVCALTAGTAMAQQAEGPWMVRVRAVNLDSANKDSTGLGLSINDKTIPELDVSYFFTPNFAAELVLTYPQKHDLRSNGAKIGSLKHLPPTLLAQYHFTGMGAFKPYVGAGINYTRFSNVNFNPAVEAALDPSIKKNSFGPAMQVGFDYMLDKNWSINFDVKKVYIKTDVSSAGKKVGSLKVDPWLVGVGVGYRF